MEHALNVREYRSFIVIYGRQHIACVVRRETKIVFLFFIVFKLLLSVQGLNLSFSRLFLDFNEIEICRIIVVVKKFKMHFYWHCIFFLASK